MAKVLKIGKDSRGNYKRDCGWEVKDGGRLRQHTFYLGQDYSEACLRYLALGRLWDVVERRWAAAREAGTSGEEKPLWDKVTLAVALAISRGDQSVILDPADFGLDLSQYLSVLDPVNSFDGWHNIHSQSLQEFLVNPLGGGMGASAEVKALERFRALEDDLAAANLAVSLTLAGMEKVTKPVKEKVERAKETAENTERLVVGPQRLHGALDAFSVWLGQQYKDTDGEPTEFARSCQRQITSIKDHSENIPLDRFGLVEIDNLLATWKARPKTKRDKTASVDHCKNCIKRIRKFIRWLHKSKEFRWRQPADYDVTPIKIARSPSELAKKYAPAQVPTYSIEELTTLYKYATPRERVYLLLALNCGFGARELVTLQVEEIKLDQDHGYYPERTGSWIKKVRVKSGVYGEWQLWPETVAAIQWFTAQRPVTGETALLVTEAGKSLGEKTKSGNRSSNLANAWNRLLGRIKKDLPDFKHLSFNKLRKTAGNLVRRVAGGEIAGIFHCRGTPVQSDNLLDLYTDRPFDKVFKALRKLRAKRLTPMFNAVENPFPTDHKKRNPSLSLATRTAIVELRKAGKKYKEICEELNVSMDTVRRYLRGAGM